MKAHEIPFDFQTAPTLVTQCLEAKYFKGDAAPIKTKFVPSASENKLILVLGGNAAGKSFFRRIVRTACHKTKTECMAISMEGRREVAYNPPLLFVYGDESHSSTGSNSASTILTGIRSSQSRLESEKHVIFWDEPDVGLSESWAASGGAEIASFALQPPNPLVAAIVVTHSKPMVRELAKASPHVLLVGENAPQSLQEWLDEPVVVRPLQELQEAHMRQFRLLQEALK
jgi:energy-coupling factor transporter ATP-binding protein EcfA2